MAAENENNVTQIKLPLVCNQKTDLPKANSLKNAFTIITMDNKLRKTVAFNEFTHEIDVVKNIPDLLIEKGSLKDEYISQILLYIENVYEVLFTDKLLNSAISNAAHQNSYNPVKDYMERVYKNWSGDHYAAKLLPTLLGVEESEITTLQTKLFFVGAVAKVYDPTTKFDFVLDLVGGQGAGKTTFLKKMANGWYTDQFTDFKDKDSYGTMLRALIVNDDEMTATNSSDFENLKKFISAEELEFRAPYARHAERRAKSFVLARTTNELTYLKDKTGERRFLPNLVNAKKQILSPVTDLTQSMIDDFWGEFVSLYKNGFDFSLTSNQVVELEKNRDNFKYIDNIEEEIEIALRTWDDDFISSNDIADKLGEKDLLKNRKLANKIKYVMDNNSNWIRSNKKIAGIPRRGYKKKK